MKRPQPDPAPMAVAVARGKGGEKIVTVRSAKTPRMQSEQRPVHALSPAKPCHTITFLSRATPTSNWSRCASWLRTCCPNAVSS